MYTPGPLSSYGPDTWLFPNSLSRVVPTLGRPGIGETMVFKSWAAISKNLRQRSAEQIVQKLYMGLFYHGAPVIDYLLWPGRHFDLENPSEQF